MSGRRAKALRRGAWAAVDIQANKCIPEYLGYWSLEGLVRRGRWATIPGSWRRLLRRKERALRLRRMLDPERTRRVIEGRPIGRATIRKPRSIGFTSMAALVLAVASFPGEPR